MEQNGKHNKDFSDHLRTSFIMLNDTRTVFFCVSFQVLRLSWSSPLLKEYDGPASLALTMGNWLHISQDQDQWRPWPLTGRCTGPGEDEAPYTGNRVQLENLNRGQLFTLCLFLLLIYLTLTVGIDQHKKYE